MGGPSPRRWLAPWPSGARFLPQGSQMLTVPTPCWSLADQCPEPDTSPWTVSTQESLGFEHKAEMIMGSREW